MYHSAFRMGIPRQGWSSHRFRQTGPATARVDEPARGCLRLYQRDDLVREIIYTIRVKEQRGRFAEEKRRSILGRGGLLGRLLYDFPFLYKNKPFLVVINSTL
jgi:hypothetical protein